MPKTTPKDYDRDGRVGMKNIKLPKGADKAQREASRKNNKKSK